MHGYNLNPSFFKVVSNGHFRVIFNHYCIHPLYGKGSQVNSFYISCNVNYHINPIVCTCVYLLLEPNCTMGNDLQSGLYDSGNSDGKEYSNYTNAMRRSCRICMVLITIRVICLQAQLMKIHNQFN